MPIRRRLSTSIAQGCASSSASQPFRYPHIEFLSDWERGITAKVQAHLSNGQGCMKFKTVCRQHFYSPKSVLHRAEAP